MNHFSCNRIPIIWLGNIKILRQVIQEWPLIGNTCPTSLCAINTRDQHFYCLLLIQKKSELVFSGGPDQLNIFTMITKEIKFLKGYWNNLTHQRLFLDDLAQNLKISDKESWYKVKWKDFKEHGGIGLLQKYNNSPSKLLSTVYSEYLY